MLKDNTEEIICIENDSYSYSSSSSMLKEFSDRAYWGGKKSQNVIDE